MEQKSKNKTANIVSWGSLTLFFVAVGILLLSWLLIAISSNEGEIVSAKMIVTGFFVLYGLPIVVLVSFVGSALGAVALYRTGCGAGKVGFALNIVILVTTSWFLWAIHTGFLQRMRTGQSKFHYALERDDLRTAKREIERGENANLPDEYGNTPLHLAISHLDRELIEILLAHDANVNAQIHLHGQEGETALHFLAKQDINPSDPLRRNQIEIARLLLEHGANPNIRARDGVWPERENVTPITLAYEKDNKEMVDLLLNYGADINVAGGNEYESLFHTAIKKCDKKMVAELIKRRADIHAKQAHGSTAFDFAIYYGTDEIVQMLIDSYPDVINMKNEKRLNETPLHVAAGQGRTEIVKLLISKGADVKAKTDIGATALHRARNKEIVELLLAEGLDVNAKTTGIVRGGLTPLHCATGTWDAELVRCLIENGADVNAKDRNGMTPLHMVTLNWNKGVAEILINNGADIYAKDNRGRTFVSIARSSKESQGESGQQLQEILAFLNEIEKNKVQRQKASNEK